MKNGQFPEIIKLADLNGQNGFKISGEIDVSSSGFYVRAAGDINGDGYADFIIGAPKFQWNYPQAAAMWCLVAQE